MHRMKTLFLLTLACAGSLTAVAAPDKVTSAVSEQSLETRLAAVLDEMVKNNSEDFYEAAALVYDASGEVTAFFRLMDKFAAQGKPAACLWKSMLLRMQMKANPALKAEFQKILTGASAGKYIPGMVAYAANGLLPEMSAAEQKKAKAVLMDACRQGSAKGRALYLMVSGRIQNGGLTQPEIASELKKNNFYLEEMIASLQMDMQSGVVWLEKASDHGSQVAPFMLSQMLQGEKAAQFMKLALERHYPAAMGHVGTEMVLRETVSEENASAQKKAEGLRMLAISAMLGNPVSMQWLAFLNASGQGAAVSHEQVYELFRMAHLCGDVDGTAGMGYCLVLGSGCKKDAKAGLALMEQARAKGAKWVNQALASMYFNGDGVAPDMRKAIDALSEDFLCGSRHAYAMMAVLTAIGNASAKPDTNAARVYLDMAVQNGDVRARELYEVFLKEGKWRFMEELLR